MNVLLNEFIKGREGNLSKEDETYLNQMKDKLFMSSGWSFLDHSRQKCENLFIKVSFRGKHLTWNQMNDYVLYGLQEYPTDFGSCCLLVPHLRLKDTEELENKTAVEIYHELKADTLNGEINGIDIVLDAEQFNYASYQNSHAAGFKIALHHHLDMPMIGFSSKLIWTGTETQINLKPII